MMKKGYEGGKNDSGENFNNLGENFNYLGDVF